MSGISILRRLLMKEAVKDTANMGSGIMTINRSLKRLVNKNVDNYITSAQKQGVDLNNMSEQELKYLIELNKPKPPKVISADSPEGKAITEQLFGKKGEVVDMTGKKIPPGARIMGGKEVKEITDVDTIIKNIKSMKPIDAMKEANSVIGRKGPYKNLTPKESKKILKDTEDHIFEKDIPIDPEDMADGGIAGMLGERVPFRYGKSYSSKKKSYSSKKKSDKDTNNWIRQSMNMMMMPNFKEPINFPYKSLEDIPPKVLAMLKKDPNFDLETFLTKVAWSDPDKTRIQEKLRDKVKYGISKGKDEEPWGRYSPRSDTSFLNYQHFGKSEPIGDGLLSIKSPTDADKVRTILHEMRHQKMKEPWFMNSSAVPKWVREYEERGEPHYLDKDIEDKFKKHRNTQKNVSGEELYVRFMDQHFGDVAESGTIAGSDYKPYFDKILKDHWDPYAKRYEDIIKEEKRVKSKPYGLADGGRTGYKDGLGPSDQPMGPVYTTNKIEDAAREVVKRLIKLDGVNIPFTDKISMSLGPNLNETEIRGVIDILGGELNFGAGIKGDDKEIGFNFTKSFADGGVAGLLGERTEYEGGGPARQKFGFGRRAFLKWMAGAGAGIGAAKSGLFGLLKGGGKKQAAKEAIKSAGSGTPPPYFFKLVEKIKTLGDDVTPGYATKEREVVKRYKDFELTEDVATGEKTIQRVKIGDDGPQYYDETLAEDVYMNYKPGKGQADETMKGKTPPNEYIEDTGYLRTTGPNKGELYDSMDGLTDDTLKEILEEVGETIVKKASGGRVPLSGGGGLFNLLKLLLKRKPKLSYLEKYPRVNIKELMKGKKPIKLYSGVGDREANTLKAYKEIAKDFNTTVDKVKKDNFKGQWWTPFEEYASSFGNPSNIKSKMLTTELTPKEIKLAKRYVEKINKKDKMISRMKMEGMDNPPKYNITTKENTVIIPKIKLKKLKKAGKIDTDYMILEKMKKKLGLAEGGLAGMLGE